MDGPARPQESQTFEAVFATEYPKMVALAAAVSGSRSRSEDIAQEAMARLHRDWDQVGSYERTDLWVRRVTINLALSWRRRLAAEGRAILRLDRTERTIPEPGEDDGALWRAVAALPKMQRTVLALRHLEGHPLTDIAEMLDISPSTARVHHHRAKETLRQRIESGHMQLGEAR